MTGKELDHPMRLILQRVLGALKHSEEIVPGAGSLGVTGQAKKAADCHFSRRATASFSKLKK